MSEAANPQPPLGVGSPVSFDALSGSTFQPVAARTRTAPFALTEVVAGSYYLFGLMDVDQDFHPLVGAMATPSCGDLTGWLTDVIGGDPVPVEVGEREVIEGLVVGPLRALTSPNPAFTVVGSRALTSADPVRLDAVAVDATFGDQRKVVRDPGAHCGAGFRFVRNDVDQDGDADLSPLLPLVEDRWPRVLYQWLGVPVGAGANRTYDRGPFGPDVTIAAIGDPEPADGVLPLPGESVDVDSLSVRWSGFGQQINPDGTTEILAGDDLPAGAWSATVLTLEGQIWTVPNEVGDDALAALLPPPGRLSAPDPRQGVVFTRD
jgi:hypothetical protein